LTQGDILTDITLFATKDGWLEKGGEPVKAPFKMCLVVSRPCAIAHKKHVQVAGIDRYPDDVPKGIDTVEKVLAFLSGARDGIRSPDVFYLGQLPKHIGRYCARLDSLHPIQLPTDPLAFVNLVAKRVGTLAPDFARDLHLRLFNAFASLGFDDFNWPSTEDLEWLVAQGNSDVAAAEHAVNQFKALKASRAAEGETFNDTDLLNAEKRLADLHRLLTPFQAEHRKRAT